MIDILPVMDIIKFRNFAYDVILSHRLTYPVNILNVVDNFSHLYDYASLKQLCSEYGADDIKNCIDERGGDALVLRLKSTGKHLVAFNEHTKAPEANWNITHEAVHILLGHTKNKRILFSTRYADDKKLEDITELVTLYILCPDVLVRELGLKWSNDISMFFNVPPHKVEKYAHYIYLDPIIYCMTPRLNAKVKAAFEKSINEWKSQHDTEFSEELSIIV